MPSFLLYILLIAFTVALTAVLTKLNVQKNYRALLSAAEDRERQANDRVSNKEDEIRGVSAELKTALEEKGRFEGQASRVQDLNEVLEQKERRIEAFNQQILTLETEKTTAENLATSAAEKAASLIATEREATQKLIELKDQQIEQMTVFINSAKETLTNEFKALSGDVLRESSGQMIKAAEQIIEKNKESTVADVKLQRQQIETMLKPVEESVKRLDHYVIESNSKRESAEALLDEQIKRLAGASE